MRNFGIITLLTSEPNFFKHYGPHIYMQILFGEIPDFGNVFEAVLVF